MSKLVQWGEITSEAAETANRMVTSNLTMLPLPYVQRLLGLGVIAMTEIADMTETEARDTLALMTHEDHVAEMLNDLDEAVRDWQQSQ